MITPSFPLTATERVLPKLALDFTTASLDPRVTFTRTGNTATVVNSSGYVTPINANLPRFDFNPITLVCRGLLIEEARTNLLLSSEDLSNATNWAITAVAVTADQAVAPDNNTTADFLKEDATSDRHSINQALTITAGTTIAFSVFLKQGVGSRNAVLQLAASVTATNRIGGTVNFSAGTFTTATNGTGVVTSSSITPFGNGWYRVTLVGVPDAAITAIRPRIGLSNSAAAASTPPTYQGDDTSGFYVWGTQAEVGAFPTSYVPTEATSVTRNADVATMTGTNFSDWYNATEGTFVTTTNKTTTAVTAIYLSANDGSNTNRMQLVWNSSTNSHSSEIVATTSQASLTTGAIATGTNKASFGYKLDNVAASVNGATPLTDTSATIPTVNTLSIGGRTYLSNNFLNGWFVNIYYYPQRLTNNEVQAFSK